MSRFRPIVFLLWSGAVFAGGIGTTPFSDEYWIRFSGRVDLSGDLPRLERMSSREARVSAVYERTRAQAMVSQAEARNTLSRRGISFLSFSINNTMWVKMDPARVPVERVLSQLRQLPGVESVTPLKPVHAIREEHVEDPTPGDAKSGVRTEPGVLDVQAPEFWAKGFLGQGLVIGSADTGVHWSHASIRNQYRGTSDAHDTHWHDAIHWKEPRCGQDSRVPCDDTEHGTHTVGTMVGNAPIGVAPQAKWIACRNMGGGLGTVASFTECFQFFLAPWPHGGDPLTDGKPAAAPHIVNNSWGCESTDGCSTGQELHTAVKTLKAAGIFVVAIAHNYGPKCGTITDAPGILADDVLTVGAHSRNPGSGFDQIADFSGRGPGPLESTVLPHLTAPGVRVKSATGRGSKLMEMSGTSMAAPHVSGAVALLWQARPEWVGDFNATRQALVSTAKIRQAPQACGGVGASAVPNNVWGHGQIRPARAAGL